MDNTFRLGKFVFDKSKPETVSSYHTTYRIDAADYWVRLNHYHIVDGLVTTNSYIFTFIVPGCDQLSVEHNSKISAEDAFDKASAKFKKAVARFNAKQKKLNVAIEKINSMVVA